MGIAGGDRIVPLQGRCRGHAIGQAHGMASPVVVTGPQPSGGEPAPLSIAMPSSSSSSARSRATGSSVQPVHCVRPTWTYSSNCPWRRGAFARIVGMKVGMGRPSGLLEHLQERRGAVDGQVVSQAEKVAVA
jgi:hypothetical protein